MLLANARMYAVTPALEAAWARLFDEVGRAAGVPLAYAPHPPPAPLDELWKRDDLGLVFVCGWPFANLHRDLQPVAAPIPADPRLGGGATYRTDFVVRAGGPFETLPATFGGRIGWTAEHSQSGFRAPRRHLTALAPGGDPEPLFGAWVGPLVTPRRVVDAVLDGAIDVGPLDAYWHELLRLHEPAIAAQLRIVASTEPTPMPLLAASPAADPDAVRRLRDALCAVGADRLEPFALAGFRPVGLADYASLAEAPA